MKKTKKNTKTDAKSKTVAKNTEKTTKVKVETPEPQPIVSVPTGPETSAQRAARLKVARGQAENSPIMTGKRGRPVGTGNRLVSLKDLVAKLGENAKIPVITSYAKKLGLNGSLFETSKGSIAKISSKYLPAQKVGSVQKIDLNKTP